MVAATAGARGRAWGAVGSRGAGRHAWRRGQRSGSPTGQHRLSLPHLCGLPSASTCLLESQSCYRPDQSHSLAARRWSSCGMPRRTGAKAWAARATQHTRNGRQAARVGTAARRRPAQHAREVYGAVVARRDSPEAQLGRVQRGHGLQSTAAAGGRSGAGDGSIGSLPSALHRAAFLEACCAPSLSSGRRLTVCDMWPQLAGSSVPSVPSPPVACVGKPSAKVRVRTSGLVVP